jgi:hypothetical protein
MCTGFWWKTLQVRDYFKNLGLGGRIMLNWVLKEMGLKCVDVWAREGTSGVSLVNAVMNLQVPLNVWNFLINCKNIRFLRRTLFCGVY